jgi:benzoyl-CoA reductase/2-hydroxyglutaryl-CoA dehydratase subunit BcrC/BadD/HgdB
MEQFRQGFLQRHQSCREWKKKGRGVMGCFYGLVPKEVVHAAGFLPVQLMEERDGRLEEKAGLLPFLCGMSKNLTGQIYEGRYQYLDGILVGVVCDTNRHVLDIWAHKKVFPYLRLLKTPSTATPAAWKFYASDLRRLAEELGRMSGQEVTEQKLWKSIELYNENRTLMERFRVSRESLGISAEEGLYVFASSLVMDVEEHNRLLLSLLENPVQASASNQEAPGVLISAMNLNMAWDLIRLVEEYGGRVVGDDFPNNARYGISRIPMEGDPFLALAKGYLRRVPAPGIYSFHERAESLAEQMRLSNAKGLIYLVQLYCDAYAMEYAILKERFDSWGIPHMRLEAEDNPASLQQLNVRVQSFLESLM